MYICELILIRTVIHALLLLACLHNKTVVVALLYFFSQGNKCEVQMTLFLYKAFFFHDLYGWHFTMSFSKWV